MTDYTTTKGNSMLPDDMGDLHQPEYFTANSGAELAGVTPHTVKRVISPDAILRGYQGKAYPIYTEATLRAFRAARDLPAGGAE